MTALEIIQEIKSLPGDETSKIVEFMSHFPNKKTIDAINEPIDELPRFRTVEELFEELKS